LNLHIKIKKYKKQSLFLKMNLTKIWQKCQKCQKLDDFELGKRQKCPFWHFQRPKTKKLILKKLFSSFKNSESCENIGS